MTKIFLESELLPLFTTGIFQIKYVTIPIMDKETKTKPRTEKRAKATQRKKKKFGFKFHLKLTKRARKILIGLLIFILIAALLFKFKHFFIAAVVNNQPITRYSLNKELKKQAGKSVLETMVTKALILQEAKRQKVRVSREEVKKKITEIKQELESQGADLDALLESQGRTRQALEEQFEVQLIIDKILDKEINVSQEEMSDYFEENKVMFAKDAKFEDVKEDLEKKLRQDKIGNKFDSWLKELRQASRVYYFLEF